MEALFKEHDKLLAKGNLSKSVEDVQKTIDLLKRARDTVVASRYRDATSSMSTLETSSRAMLAVLMLTNHRFEDHSIASLTLAKLQNPVKQSFDVVNSDLKEIHKVLGDYSKALDKVMEILAAKSPGS